MTNAERKTVTLDATDKILGRFATQIAMALMGKNSAAFQSHVDAGDNVVVANVGKLAVTGRKMAQKLYHHHTGHPGGLRTKTMAAMWQKDPADVLRAAVSRMLPKNKHRKNRMMRLTVS